MMNEKTVTPDSIVNEIMIFSLTDFGKKSPYPIVVRVVIP